MYSPRPTHAHYEERRCTAMGSTPCPVYREHALKEDVTLCPMCHWQHDRVQEAGPDFAGGANQPSLNEYEAVLGKEAALGRKHS